MLNFFTLAKDVSLDYVVYEILLRMTDNEKPYAFFISYRRTSNTEADKFIHAFVKQLKKQVALSLPDIPIFFDKEKMLPADDLSKLAHCLCRSATMVMIFTPLYFDSQNTWCAREYMAMLDLERGRSLHVREKSRLIIPVVFRGEEHLPSEISDHILYENFDHVVKESQFETSGCQQRIKEISDQICSRYLELLKAGIFDQQKCICSDFKFPAASEITAWLTQVTPLPNSPLMPGH